MAAAASDPATLRSTIHGAPLWARAATVAAGPVFNFVMSIAIFAALIMVRGVVSDPFTVGEIRTLPAGHYELREGDELVSIAGLDVPGFEDGEAWTTLRDTLPRQDPLDYVVRRDGRETTIQGPFFYPPFIVQVAPRSAAMDIELRPGDVITGIEGTPIVSFEELKDKVETSNGRVLLIDVWRDGEVLEFALAPRRTDEPDPDGGFRTEWRIGIAGGMAVEPASDFAGPIAAIQGGAAQTWRVVEGSLSGIWHMITGAISTCNIAGPIGIAETSGDMASQGAGNFIAFIAILSAAVGLLNLFPVPALDGGHLMFFAYEAITGRPPSDLALRVLMALGIALILTLMVFALGNDLFC